MIVCSQDGRAFVDLELTMCVKINVRHVGAFDILAMSGAVTQWLGTYNNEDDATVVLGMLLVKKTKHGGVFIMPGRSNKNAIDELRAKLQKEANDD